eukprot:gene17892-biopygen416
MRRRGNVGKCKPAVVPSKRFWRRAKNAAPWKRFKTFHRRQLAKTFRRVGTHERFHVEGSLTVETFWRYFPVETFFTVETTATWKRFADAKRFHVPPPAPANTISCNPTSTFTPKRFPVAQRFPNMWKRFTVETFCRKRGIPLRGNVCKTFPRRGNTSTWKRYVRIPRTLENVSTSPHLQKTFPRQTFPRGGIPATVSTLTWKRFTVETFYRGNVWGESRKNPSGRKVSLYVETFSGARAAPARAGKRFDVAHRRKRFHGEGSENVSTSKTFRRRKIATRANEEEEGNSAARGAQGNSPHGETFSAPRKMFPRGALKLPRKHFSEKQPRGNIFGLGVMGLTGKRFYFSGRVPPRRVPRGNICGNVAPWLL